MTTVPVNVDCRKLIQMALRVKVPKFIFQYPLLLCDLTKVGNS
jgi:hypothetical protein